LTRASPGSSGRRRFHGVFGAPAAALAAAAALVAVPPHVLSEYALLMLSAALVFSIACLGLNLLFGTTGLLPLGHATFFGLGAYAGAFLYRFGPLESLELYLGVGVAGTAAAAALIGFFCVRATRMHFAILSLGFAQLVHALFINGTVFQPFGGLGKGLYLLGGGGLYIPRFAILGVEYAGPDFTAAYYRVIALSFLGAAALLWRVGRSPFGMALRAIRDNDERAAQIGIPVRRFRYQAFALSGAVVGLAGALYGQLSRQVTPDQLDWLFSAKLVLMTVLGGSRDFLGPVLGAFAFVALDEAAAAAPVPRGLAMGLGLIAVVLAVPRGLAGGLMTVWGRLRRPPAPKAQGETD
jgi:branched-chain amino acid transport system permease protein